MLASKEIKMGQLAKILRPLASSFELELGEAKNIVCLSLHNDKFDRPTEWKLT